MASVLPQKNLDLLDFCETHWPVWLAAPATSIGLSENLVNSLKVLTETARNSYSSAQTARSASKAATGTYNDDISLMRTKAADLIRQIKSYAELQANPNTVFNAAEIPAPLPPAPVGPPGTPDRFTVGLAANGAVLLAWRCVNPSGSVGTQYEVRRKIGSGSFQLLGVVGPRRFTDNALPSGSSGVVYEITAIRTTTRGLPAQFNVNFGVGGDGQPFATVTNVAVTPVKMAA